MAIEWHISTTRAFRIAVTLCRAWDRLSLQPATGEKNQNRGECLRFELFSTARELGIVEAEPLTNDFFYYVNFRQQKMREKIVYYYLHPRIYFPKLLAVFDKKLVLRSFIEVSSFLLVASFQQTMGTTFSAVKTLNTSYTLIKFQARREPLHCRIRFLDGNRFFARFINSLWNQRSKPVLFMLQAHRDCSH